ncbi:O-antigen/teichoic acid export membrane protein [Catalinimonas alkaloidigena]|uniref:flippase n=1 Tax=Catalinimonas alkaloidigena TaxID=1075417 RepID=UPI0024067647|nr:flippase [Catalinimonas alkaloidigena]MDF9799673.1 O-antigen/teichoic acid export membrane protein [Catalinimonas alkaloidigena]
MKTLLSKINELKSQLMKSEMLKKVSANMSWLFFERMIMLAVTLAVGVYVARYLGPKYYGILNFAISFIALFIAIANLGLQNVLVKELVEHEDDHNIFMGSAFLMKLLGSIILLIIVFFSSQLMELDASTRIIVFIIGAGLLFKSLDIIGFFFQSEVRSKFEAIARTTSLLSISAIKVILILAEAPLFYFALVYMLEHVITSTVLIIFYMRQGRSITNWRVDKKAVSYLFSECWPIIISGLVVSIHLKVDQVMINQMLGDEDVGYYAAAAKISDVWYFIPTIIMSSVFPVIVKTKNRSERLFGKQLHMLYDAMVILSLSVAIPLTFLSDWLINLLYGPEYILTGKVLSIHIWSAVFGFMNVVRGKWAVIEKQQRFGVFIQGSGAFVNIALNFFLIPAYGIIGAAIATLITVASNVLIAPLFINANYRGQVRIIVSSLNPFSLVPRLSRQIKTALGGKEYQIVK